jgi:hypothetical protein
MASVQVRLPIAERDSFEQLLEWYSGYSQLSEFCLRVECFLPLPT